MVTKVYVKPVGEQWGVFEFTPWQDFWDDVRRFLGYLVEETIGPLSLLFYHPDENTMESEPSFSVFMRLAAALKEEEETKISIWM